MTHRFLYPPLDFKKPPVEEEFLGGMKPMRGGSGVQWQHIGTTAQAHETLVLRMGKDPLRPLQEIPKHPPPPEPGLLRFLWRCFRGL